MMRYLILVLASLTGWTSAQGDFGKLHKNLFVRGFSRFGQPFGATDGFTEERLLEDDWEQIWTETGTVPEKLPEVPKGRMFISYPSGISIKPNDTVTSGLLLQPPKIEFQPKNPNALHTVLMFDMDLAGPGDSEQNFNHMVITNVPGSNVDVGDIIYSYLPSFTSDISEAEGLKEDSDLTHRYVWLALEQQSRLQLQSEKDFCSREALKRIMLLKDFVAENNLGPVVAGNFHRNRFSGQVTKDFICFASKCFGGPWPFVLPGVNDRPECQPSPESQDPK